MNTSRRIHLASGLAATFVTLLALACGGTTTPTETGPVLASLSGTLSSSIDGGPLVGATVRLQSRSVTTSGTGTFEFTNLRPGNEPLVAWLDGESPTSFNVSLKPGSNTVSLVFPMDPHAPATLSGLVVAYNGVVPGVTVTCQGKSTTTGADGTYFLGGLVSGPWLVNIKSATIGTFDTAFTLKPGPNTLNISSVY